MSHPAGTAPKSPRDVLLGKAIDWYAAHGVVDTSMRTLAAGIGTSNRMLNYHFGTREDLIAGYESTGGAPVDRAELHAWEVFQTMNWGVMCAGVAEAFVEGSRSIEAGVIARRASETEFDLMRLLAPDHGAWHVR